MRNSAHLNIGHLSWIPQIIVIQLAHRTIYFCFLLWFTGSPNCYTVIRTFLYFGQLIEMIFWTFWLIDFVYETLGSPFATVSIKFFWLIHFFCTYRSFLIIFSRSSGCFQFLLCAHFDAFNYLEQFKMTVFHYFIIPITCAHCFVLILTLLITRNNLKSLFFHYFMIPIVPKK